MYASVDTNTARYCCDHTHLKVDKLLCLLGEVELARALPCGESRSSSSSAFRCKWLRSSFTCAFTSHACHTCEVLLQQ